MLSSNEASVQTPSGLNRRFAYFCTRNFFIRGGRELRDCESNLFELCKDHVGDEFLRFSPGLCKNWKVDVRRCSSESLKKPVNCYDSDVISTYKCLISHWPIYDPVDTIHPLFLNPKLRLRPFDVVWFSRGAVGRNTLSDITRTLAETVPALKSKKITNKSGRATGITRMEEAGVPREKGMIVTGHRDSKSYGKYSRESVDLSSKVLQRVISGHGTSFEEVYADEVLRRGDEKVNEVLKGGSGASASTVQGITGASEVVIGDSKLVSMLQNNDMKRIVTVDEAKPGHVFQENNNCQIINFVINGLDSQYAVAEILKNLGPNPFLSK